MSEKLRMCVVCRTMKDKTALLRIAKNKDGEISVDKKGCLPGRGAYICREGDCREKFIKSRSFERAFRCAVSDEVKENIMKELIQ